MFKSLKSTLLGNILSSTYYTTIWKLVSGNKVPGSFPNNISCLKIGIREIHQRKSYFRGRMKCKQQGNWKKQFGQREVVVNWLNADLPLKTVEQRQFNLSRNLVLGTTLFSGGPLSLQPPYPILYPFLCFSHPETATWKKERRRLPSENAISFHIPSFNTKSYISLQQPRTDFYIGIRQSGEHTYQW